MLHILMVITVVIIKISNIFIGTTLIDGFKLVCMGCVCFTVTIVWHYDIVLDYWFRNFRFGTETYVLHRVSKNITPIQLAIISTYTVLLQQFLAQMLPRK